MEPVIPMEPVPEDDPICYSWYLFSRSGGLLAGPRGPESTPAAPLLLATEKYFLGGPLTEEATGT